MHPVHKVSQTASLVANENFGVALSSELVYEPEELVDERSYLGASCMEIVEAC